MIATDPEDRHTASLKGKDKDTTKLPQRYLKMTPEIASDNRVIQNSFILTAELVMDQPKRFFFKLRSPEEKKLSQSLPESRWLPEASGGSQPYFIQPKGERSLFRKNKFFYIKQENSTVKGDTLTRGDDEATVLVGAVPDSDPDGIASQLFVLTPGHKT